MSDEAKSKGLEFSDAFGFCMQLQGRLDALWQRILYSHAAIVGVMVYFANTANPHPIPRMLVLAFYSINIVITLVAMRESYAGLVAVITDLKDAHAARARGAFERWLVSLDYGRHLRRRFVVLGLVWVLVSYLLIAPLLL